MLNWGGKKWRPGGSRPQPNRINQSVSELMKPLGEKSWQGNVWGSVIMNVEKGEPTPQPTPTPSVTPTLTPTPTTPAWNPSQLTNLFDWWTNTDGITTSGSDVLSWEGYNGNLFTPQNNTYKPQYNSTDSNWNLLPSITINPTNVLNTSVGMNSPASTGTTSKTMIVVSRVLGYPNSSYGYTGFFTIGTSQSAQRMSILLNPNNNTFDGFNSNTNNETIFGSLSVPQYTNAYVEYDYTTGVYNYTTSSSISSITGTSSTNTGSSGFNWAVNNLGIGSYTTDSGNGELQTSVRMSIVEVIALDKVLTPTDITNINTYLTNKYTILPTPTPTPTPTLTPTITASPVPIVDNILTEGGDNIQLENGNYLQFD